MAPLTWQWGIGRNSSTFYQDSAREFFKIDEKTIGGGVVANYQRSTGRGQIVFIYAFSLM